ncbi:hypothetical protein KEM54_006351 [Ascosphaera aggregata]|nr:hypothetical protein KEM54_006351 [Ascosphaera aggregata]
MSQPDESVDFSLIEEQKENIQSLPGGRSARALAAVLSSGAVSNTSSSTSGLNETNEIHTAIRKEFEEELSNIDESDDPLDIYDRYVKWTFNAYPSAQATPQSGLLSLLERATRAFLTSSDYKNDPRYLRLWLHYIRLFSDAPREVFVFLIRNGIGERLALYYEEFAVWLEGAGRFSQAEQIYKMGLEKEARPIERLSRKYREFLKRVETKSRVDEPTSPVIPKIRPALQAKVDPFAPARGPSNPHAQFRDAAPSGAPKSKRTGKPKLQIFSDADSEAGSESAPSEASQGLDSIGFMKERKKENTYEPKPWKGQTLKGSGRPERAPKLLIYKDEPLAKSSALISDKTLRLRETVNPRSGKVERIFANLELLYPRGARAGETEMSIDEARAASRGWLLKNWSYHTSSGHPKPVQRGNPMSPIPASNLTNDASLRRAFKEQLVIHEDVSPGPDITEPEQPLTESYRSPKTYEATSQTRAVKTKLDSPTVTRVKRKDGSSEPTMTFHTRAATDEIYGIFNQPLKSELRADDDESPYQSDGYDDDDFTTTTNVTQRVSGSASDFCEGDTTYLNRTSEHVEERSEEITKDSATTSELTNVQDLEQITSPFSTEDRDNDTKDQDDNVSTPRKMGFPDPPDGYDPPNGTYRNREIMAQSRLHFMTPIAERTEVSVVYSPNRHNENDSIGSRSVEDATNVPQRPMGIDKTRFSGNQDGSPSKSRRTSLVPEQLSLQQSDPSRRGNASIVTEKQCNPVDDKIKEKILGAIDPPLDDYPGFYRHSGSEDEGAVKKFRPGLAKILSSSKNRRPAVFRFDDIGGCYVIKRQLGKGGFASVFLARVLTDCLNPERLSVDDLQDSGPLEALKIEGQLNSSWEFYMLRTAAFRLQSCPEYSRCVDSVLEAYEMHCFDDEGYLAEEYIGKGTLLDLVNVIRAQVGLVSRDEIECLAMFFTVELLRVMEGLHACGILHGDVKADNCLVRLSTSPVNGEPQEILQYSAEGKGIWGENGIKLIDFGRGIDMKAFPDDVQFIAEWQAGAHECPEMRENRPWTHQIDLYGIAGVMHVLLFHENMEVKSTPAGLGGRPTYQIKKKLKRYWNQDIWTEVFDLCLNPLSQKWNDIERAARAFNTPTDENTPPKPALPVISSMRLIRGKMEEWLVANSGKKHLYTRLKYLDDLLSKYAKEKIAAAK